MSRPKEISLIRKLQAAKLDQTFLTFRNPRAVTSQATKMGMQIKTRVVHVFYPKERRTVTGTEVTVKKPAQLFLPLQPEETHE